MGRRRVSATVFDDRSSGNGHRGQRDVAYEALGLFTEEKMEKYCTKMMANDGGDNDNEALTQIDMDSENICELYWFVQYLFR